MLTGCVQSVFFPRVNAATARVLATVAGDVDRVLCGEPALHFWNFPARG